MTGMQEQLVNVIAQWALALEHPVGHINRKILFGDEALAPAVEQKLRGASTDECAFVVRNSTDRDAVLLRNERPVWASPNAAVIYLVFWLPGHTGHEKNYESLRDFPSVSLVDFLSRTDRFVLPGEVVISARCKEAAAAWEERDRARAAQHLEAAWLALRTCLRERRGGRDRSIPFFDNLASYLAFLEGARVPDAEWNGLPAKARPATLVERWGRALPCLAMFRLPALASVIGVQTNPDEGLPSPSKSGEGKWVTILEEILAENKEVSIDFAGLEEDIAGKQTLRERLDDLTRNVPLCEDEANRAVAREALERFCQSGDATAFELVDWLFLRDRKDRRSPSQGLKGLLIARKLRAPRPNPLEKLAGETIDVLEQLAGDEARESGTVKQYVMDLRGGTFSPDRRSALAAAEVLRGLASGTLPPGTAGTPMGAIFIRALDSPARNTIELERLARAWEKYGRPDGDAPVKADNFLFGLVQLCVARLRDEKGDYGYRFDSTGQDAGFLVFSTQVEGERRAVRVPVIDWSQATRDRIFNWLRDEVRPLYFSEELIADAEDDEEGETAVTVDIEWIRGTISIPFGVMELTLDRQGAPLLQQEGPESLSSFVRDGGFPGASILTELFRSKSAEKNSEDPRDESVRKAWKAFNQEIGWDPGCAAVAVLAPISSAGRSWVDAWAHAVETASAGVGVQKAIEELERQLDAAEDPSEIKRLHGRIKELRKQSPGEPKYDIESIRSLLRLCTGTVMHGGSIHGLLLTPYHPLVLRLRVVGDDILANTLRQLWTSGWDKCGLDDLEGALDEWGLPEPIHCYGHWDGEPLVFEDWVARRFALFSPLGSGREVDASRLGVKQVANELGRYRQLFPAAADRLRIRLQGDHECGWAWSVLGTGLDRTRLVADVDVITDLPARQPNRIDQAVQADETEGRSFEPGVDGELPAIRIRRQAPTANGDDSCVHVAAVVGDLIETFRSSITLMACPSDGNVLDVYDPRLLFYEPVPELFDYSLMIGDPPDRLSNAVGRLVAQAASHPGQVFKEKYSFDRTRNLHLLQRLQRGAHWLVLTSRQPLYRAVQQCGTSKLLDFYSAVERGRPVHTCVSLSNEQAELDVGRLAASITALVRHHVEIDTARGVLDAARSLAPGLAMQCIGAAGGTTLSGLLGLLLSARRNQSDDELVLCLDQHRDLLTGGGQLSDILRLRVMDGKLHVEVIEAKFTTGGLVEGSAPLVEAERQVASTIQRLSQFTLQHPLILRTRARLARAIVQRIHLGAPNREQAEMWRHIIDAALDPMVPIVVSAATTGAVHGWSVADGSADRELTSAAGNKVWIHCREATLRALRQLGS